MNAPASTQSNFDPIARPYRWLELLMLGRTLERCRLHFLPQLSGCSNALVLGDGDGRFLSCLLRASPRVTADVVDTSAAMLALLRHRCAFAFDRVRIHQKDAIAFTGDPCQNPQPYDLVVTHFFLDCLTQPQVDFLADAIARNLAPGAVWIVSEFRIPPNRMRLPATALVRVLYLAFRLLTGLRTTRLPDHAAALARAGLRLTAEHHSLFGCLSAELWTM